MVSTKNLISSNIINQVPNFIADEYPLFVDFIQTYYQGLENSGQPLDLVNNLLEYLDVDTLQSDIKETCKVSTSISLTDTTITVDSTNGFPDTDGLIQINSEIILYKAKTQTQFLNCSRGISGVTNLGSTFEYNYSSKSEHAENSLVYNLSYLFLLYFFSKIKNNYLPFFDKNLFTDLNISTFIKNIKQFYNSKGTTKSFNFLIKALFNVENETLYTRDRLILPSSATYFSPTIIRCFAEDQNGESLKNLTGQYLYQSKIDRDPLNYNSSDDKIVSYAVTSVEEIFEYEKPVYQLSVDKVDSDVLPIISPETKLIKNLSANSTDNIISVDSTIGFPDKNGFLQIENEIIKYEEKTLNEFLGCTRGYYGNGITSHNEGTLVETTLVFYGYSNITNEKIYIKNLGVISGYEIGTSGKLYGTKEKIETAKLGYSGNEPILNSLLYNFPAQLSINTVNNNIITTNIPHNLHVGDKFIYFSQNSSSPVEGIVGSINSEISFTTSNLQNIDTNENLIVSVKKYNSKFLTDVMNVYRNNDGYYISSSGLPSHPVGTGFTLLGNQRYLKKIPSEIITSEEDKISSPKNKDIGIFVNGVTLESFVDSEIDYYGEILSFNILNSGKNYGVGINGGPIVNIFPSSTGTGVTTTAKALIDGKVIAAKVINGGSGYSENDVVRVIGSNGDGASLELVVDNGEIINVNVLESGSGYNFLPTVEIFGSGGTGAIIKLDVQGPISEVYNLNDGLTYGVGISLRDNPNFNLNVGRDKIEITTNQYTDLLNVYYDGTLNQRYFNLYTRSSSEPEKIYLTSTGSINIYSGLPIASVFDGEGATAQPVISNGQIISVLSSTEGFGYNSSPKVLIEDTSGAGFGAEIYANIENGKVISYTVLNGGANYNPNTTRVSVISNGTDAFIQPVVRTWTRNLFYKLNSEDNPLRLDNSYGYEFDSKNFSYGKRYSYLANPKELRKQLSDNINSNLTEPTTNFIHSKILGWSYDGHPIYGPYGTAVTDAVTFGSGTTIERLVSKYTLNEQRVNGPSIDEKKPLGYYVEDYSANNSDTTLDEFNGRYCNTPEFPDGVYAYFVTIDPDGTPEFPYVIGPKYKSIPDDWNFKNSEQSILPDNVLRYRDIFEKCGYTHFPKVYNPANISIKDIKNDFNSNITGFNILYSGTGYTYNDRLVFNNENTGGYGSSAKVTGITAGGGITSIKLIGGGNFYNSLPEISINSVNGKDAYITPITNSIGALRTLEINDVGYGYPSDYTVNPEFLAPTVLQLKNVFSVKNVNYINGTALNYFSEPLIEIVGGNGFLASAKAILSNNSIETIEVLNSGYGYTHAPTANVYKKYFCRINGSNIVFNYSIENTFSTGQSVKIQSETNTLPSPLPSSSGNVYWVITNPSNPYVINLASSRANSIAAQPVKITFTNSGNNIFLIKNVPDLSLTTELYKPDFIIGETISQGETATGIVSGWDSKSSVIRLTNINGNFSPTSNLPIVGKVSNTRAFIGEITITKGKLDVSVIGNNSKVFLDEVGFLNSKSQVIIDSNYYQNYAYVLKNSINYDKWASQVKNIVHPVGFQLFGQKTSNTDVNYGVGITSSNIILRNNIFRNLSTREYPSYYISLPDYTTTDTVDILNKKLTSYETIKTSYVQVFDNIGNGSTSYIGSGRTYTIPTQYALMPLGSGEFEFIQKSDIDVYVNDVLQDSDTWKLTYIRNGSNIIGANVVLDLNLNSNQNVDLIFKGLKFDHISGTTIFPLSINNNPTLSQFRSNQVLVFLNGILQDDNSYSISTRNTLFKVNFSNSVRTLVNTNNDPTLRIFGLQNNCLNTFLIGTGISSYSLGNNFNDNSTIVSIGGLIIDKDRYSINNQIITFSDVIGTGSTISVRDFGNNIISSEIITAVSTGRTFTTSINLGNNKHNLLIINGGIIIDPNQYNISSGSTIIFTAGEILVGEKINVYVLSPNSHVEFFVSRTNTQNYNSQNSNISTFNNTSSYQLTPPDEYYVTNAINYIVCLNGILQIPGNNYAYTISATTEKSLNFVEAPIRRTKFYALLYNRYNSSDNARLDDISKSYLQYDTLLSGEIDNPATGISINGTYLQQENNKALAIVDSYNPNTKTIVYKQLGSGNTFGVGVTFVCGTGITTNINTIITEQISDNQLDQTYSNFTVQTTSNLLVGDYIKVDTEVMKIINVSTGNSTLTVSRGLLGTDIRYHFSESMLTKLNLPRFISNNIYTGFNGSKRSFNLSTGASSINYEQDKIYRLNYGNITPFSLPNTGLDIYGKNNDQSLFLSLNGIVQNCTSGTGNSGFSGTFSLSNNQIIFEEDSAPSEGTNFFARYFGKLRRLKDISYLFDGVTTSFTMNIGGTNENIVYSLESENSNSLSNNLIIFINGIFQIPNESFEIIGSKIIFKEPPVSDSTFYGFVYIGSDEDVNSFKISSEIEINDYIDIDTEVKEREILGVESSTTLLTSNYNLEKGNGATANVVVAYGKIISVNITNSGNGYTKEPIIWFNSSSGKGAQAYCRISNGRVVEVVVTNGGSGYSQRSTTVVFAKDTLLTKKSLKRSEYNSKISKIISTRRSVSSGASVIFLETVSNIPETGTATIIDNSKGYTVVEKISYSSVGIGNSSLEGCIRKIRLNYDKILLMDRDIQKPDSENYGSYLSSTISTGVGNTITASVVSWGNGNTSGTGTSLIFINNISGVFTNTQNINTVGTILNSSFENIYFSYPSGTKIIFD